MELDNQQEKMISDLSWLAAAWESEGHFTLSWQKLHGQFDRVRPICGLTNTDLIFINEAISILKKYDLSYYVITRNGTNRLRYDVHIWGIKRVHRFLNAIYPYLRSKKDRAKILKDFVDFRLSLKKSKEPYGEYEISLYNQLKELNNRRNHLSSSETTRKTS
jgi:hypothetical protein